MIGDRIIPQPHHTRASERIVELLDLPPDGRRPIVTVAGESGSGKSEIAAELFRLYKERGYAVYIFAQDDYFFYPPKTNDKLRRNDIGHVGTGEVNLALLDEHIGMFVEPETKTLHKPLVLFDEDRITEEIIEPCKYDMGVAEGTYTSLLDNATYRVFIDRTHEDTLDHRLSRSRDPIDAFSVEVLRIEHEIISKHRPRADIIVDKEYEVGLTDLGKGRL